MWDERYSTDDYVYGTEPNDFLREQAERLGEAPKRVLCLAEKKGVALTTLTAAELEADFAKLEIQLSHECERKVLEGRGHTGPGCVVQFIARER